MTVANNDDADNKASAPHQGPGSLLKKARERQGIEIGDVAAQLHLPTSIVKSLEADDFENLPGPVFAKGYLRNYARLFGLNEDSVVSAYQRLQPATDEQVVQPSTQETKSKIKSNKPMHSSHGVMQLATWGVVLVLAVLVFFWWWNQADLEVPESFPPIQESQQESLPELEMPSQDRVEYDQQQTPPVVTELEPVEAIAPAPATNETSTPEQTDSFEEAPAPQTDSTSMQQTSEPVPDVASPQEERLDTAVVETDDENLTQAKTLLFEFSGACWTEVRDLDGKVRIIGEMRTGTRRSLSSQYGPFLVVLGDVDAVSLKIDGQPFNLKPFTRGKVARFTLDPEKL
jgi:cytoskeleton protein RodZ